MSTQTIEKTDTIEHLDFAVTCTYRLHIITLNMDIHLCEQEAKWSVRWQCNGHGSYVGFACQKHLDEILAGKDRNWGCSICNTGDSMFYVSHEVLK